VRAIVLPEEVTSVGEFTRAKVWQQFRYGVRDASKSRTQANHEQGVWKQFRRGIRDASKSPEPKAMQFRSGIRDASKLRTDDASKNEQGLSAISSWTKLLTNLSPRARSRLRDE
jgi:hypothetical protein